MVNKTIQIYSHPRSGSNYFAELIDLNISRSGDYNDVYGGHGIAKEKVLANPDVIYLYIKREFIPVSKSLYKMRARFGLEVNSYEDLLLSKYKDIYNSKFNSLVKISRKGQKYTENKISRHFASIDMTPREYHSFHIKEWEKLSINNNVMIISYEDLKNDFSEVLKSIVIKFSLNIDMNFKNIEEKVGYSPIENGLKIKFFSFGNHLLKIIRRIYYKAK